MNFLKLGIGALLLAAGAHSNASPPCSENTVYNRGDVCSHSGTLYMSTYWSSNSFPGESSAWIEIDTATSTPWSAGQSYQRGSVVEFGTNYYAAVDWNHSNCPVGTSDLCTENASNYYSWVDLGPIVTDAALTIKVTKPYPEAHIEGALVMVDDLVVGQLDENNEFEYREVVKGSSVERNIRVVVPSSLEASQIVTLRNKESQTKVFELSEPFSYTEPHELVGVPNILEPGFSGSFSFNHNGADANIVRITDAFLHNPRNSGKQAYADIRGALDVDLDGTIRLIDPLILQAASEQLGAGKIELTIMAQDNYLLNYENSNSFYFANSSLDIQVIPPTDYPNADLSTAIVKLEYLIDNQVFPVSIDSTGKVAKLALPKGNWVVSASWQGDNGHTYNASGPFNLNNGIGVNLYLRSLDELIQGKTELVRTSSPLMESYQSDPERLEIERGLSPAILQESAPGGIEKIWVQAGASGRKITRSKTYSAEPGVGTAWLEYSVYTQEYPTFVLRQSVFNDAWSIKVVDSNGGILYEESREVNSQLAGAPLWKGNGSTGNISEVINLGQVPLNISSYTLIISSTNIGDSALPTVVRGGIGVNALVIEDLERVDTIAAARPSVANYVSIPEPGNRNHFERKYRVKVSKPADVTITGFEVYLVAPAGTTEDVMVLQGIVGGDGVEEVADNEFLVTNTFTYQAANGITGDAPFHGFNYKFVAIGDQLGNELRSEKETSRLYALWEAPPLETFSNREAGGDKWASKSTHEWITTNIAQMQRTNDISGEHGRYIGHITHKQGDDIDIFHFTDLTGGTGSGGWNLDLLANHVAAALNGNVESRETVIGWISSERAGLDLLTQTTSVHRVYSADGNPIAGLPDHWHSTLMRTGTLTVGENTLNTELGAWSNADVGLDDTHNSHVHITLSH